MLDRLMCPAAALLTHLIHDHCITDEECKGFRLFVLAAGILQGREADADLERHSCNPKNACRRYEMSRHSPFCARAVHLLVMAMVLSRNSIPNAVLQIHRIIRILVLQGKKIEQTPG